MDKQRPLWRTGWCWKQFCFCLIPGTVVMATLAALIRTQLYSDHTTDLLNRLMNRAGLIISVATGMWMNYKIKQRIDTSQSTRNQ